MQVTVLVFAQLTDAVGTDRVTIELPGGATAADALDALIAQHPSVGVTRNQIALAIDDAYCAAETRLEDGQTLALIPPVSGG